MKLKIKDNRMIKSRYSIVLLIFFMILTALNTVKSQEPDRPKQRRQFDTKITGKVIDNDTKAPIEGASAVLYGEDTTKRISGVPTDKNGIFEIEKIKPGRYELRISYIGYSTARFTGIMIAPETPQYNAGEIKLTSGSETIAEIEVTAERNIMEMGIDKKVFNVEKMLTAESGSAIDVLKNVPSVTVDSDGNVSIRGTGNVKFLINGKPSGLLANNPSTYLEQIPANMIESVEIINNPSAKYDPEGMSGIININLKKENAEDKGYNFNLNSSVGTKDKYNITTGLTYKTGNLSLYGNYGLRLFNFAMQGNSNRINYLFDSAYYFNSTTTANMRMLGHTVTGGFDYDINKKNYLGFSLSYNSRDRNRNEKPLYSNSNSNNILTYKYYRDNFETDNGYGLDATLNYKLKFDRKKEELNASVQYSKTHEDEKLNINQYNEFPFTGSPIIENDYTVENYNMLSIQADYFRPIKEKHKFEAGIKGIIRSTDNDFRVENYDYGTNSFKPNTLLSNTFKYNEQIYSAYGTYENSYKKFGYQLGLRLEEALTNSEQLTTSNKYENNYFSFFPSIYLKQGITETNEIQLSYVRRINRPNMRNLNPFIDYSDPQNLRFGNPYLKPEYINSFELGYIKYFPTFSLTSSLFYRITNDVITRYITATDSGVSYFTFENLSKAYNYGFEIIGAGSLYKWWTLNASVSYFKSELSGNINSAELNNSGYSWSAKFMSSMTFPNLFDIQLSYFYTGESVSAQGTMQPMQSLDVALKKDFLNKRMSLGIRISDLFNTQKFAFNASGTGFTGDTYRKRDSRAAFLTFTYRIGTEDRKMRRDRQRQQQQREEDNGRDNDF